LRIDNGNIFEGVVERYDRNLIEEKWSYLGIGQSTMAFFMAHLGIKLRIRWGYN
jgi:hypothetical protein